MQNWALSKQEPGQFTGTTGVKVLSQEELSSGHQAWARKVGIPTYLVGPANKWVVKGLEVVLRSDAFITDSFSKLSCSTSFSLSVHEVLLCDSWEQKAIHSKFSKSCSLLYLYHVVMEFWFP